MVNKDFDFRQFYLILLKHIYLFAGIVIITMTVTAAYLYKAKRIYQATVSIEIEPRSANILGSRMEAISSGASDYYWSNKEYFATQYEIIQSRAVSSKVMENLSKENVLQLLGVKEESQQEEKAKDIDTVALLQAKISVNPSKNSNIVKLSVTDPNPETAAFLANNLASSYIEFNLEKKYTTSKDAAKWLSEQSVNLKKELEDSELALFNFKKNNEVLSSTFEEKQTMLTQNIIDINKKLTEKQIYHKTLTAKIDELSLYKYKEPEEFFSTDLSFNNTLLQNLKMSYLQIRSKLKEKIQFYGEKHPEIMGLKGQEESIRKSLLNEISGVIGSFQLENKTLENELKKLQTMLLEAQREAVKLNKLEIDYNKLKREVETNKKLYDIVLERTKQADLSSLLRANNIRIIDKALVPKMPVQPRKNFVLIIGFIIAILGAFAVVFLTEFLDTRIRDMEELESIVGKSIIGVFPTFVIEDTTKIREIAFEGSKHSPSVEALRTIRTNIRLAHPDINAKTMLITSSISQEGKTTVSANVAISFAIAGRRTLIVDTDMRKPRIHKLFGIENKEGISTYMLGEKPIEQLIKKDVYGGLDVLLCGPIPPNPAEMIESKRFKDMVDKLKTMYDIIVFDSPPVVAVSDASVLSTMMDGVLIVVKIKQISRDILKRSVGQLKKSGVLFLGAIVNNVDIKAGSRYGSYYYYYHNKYYGESEEKKS